MPQARSLNRSALGRHPVHKIDPQTHYFAFAKEGLFACHTAEIERYAIEARRSESRLRDSRPQRSGDASAGRFAPLESEGHTPEHYDVLVLRILTAALRDVQRVR